MTDEVLDDSRKKKHRKLRWNRLMVPAILITGLVISNQHGWVLSRMTLTSMVLLAASLITVFYQPVYGTALISLTCIAGVAGLCRFFPEQRFFGFGIGGFMITLEVYTLLCLIGNIILTWKEHRIIIGFFGKNEGNRN